MYKTDLHIHTCLSPCAELDMSPMNIVKQAQKCGLDIIGICDHNTCENIPYIKKSAEREGLNFFGGIEITSKEEVHILALFDHEEELFAMQQIIYDNLHGTNDEKMYGFQVVVDENNNALKLNNKFLMGATELSVDKIVETVHKLNGLAIASHIDRESFSIIGQLGFIPSGLELDAIELSTKEKIDHFKFIQLPFIISSDSHRLDTIGRNYIQFYMDEVNLEEIKKSLQEKEGRMVII